MSGFADRVQKAFEAKQVRVIEVTAWGLSLHVFPLTIRQLQAINAEKDEFSRLVRELVVRGKDATGAPVFDEEDFRTLCSHGVGAFGPDAILRVVQQIRAGDTTPEEAGEKKA